MPLPDLLQYDNLSRFLQDVAASKRLQSPRWSFGVWARQLELSNVATLTRIVQGDRQPGEALCSKLESYFEFDSVLTVYFRLLVELERQKEKPELCALIRQKLQALSAGQRASPARVSDGLEMSGGRLLALWGAASLVGVNQALLPWGLEAIPQAQQAMIGVCVVHYTTTTVGPYSECYASVVAKPVDAGLESFGLAFHQLRTDSSRLATFGRLVWGNEYAQCDAELAIASSGGRASVQADGKPWLTMVMSEELVCESCDEDNQLQGFSCSHAPARYPLKVKMRGTGRAFAPGDVFDPCESALGSWLTQIQFTPQRWRRYPELSCSVGYPLHFGLSGKDAGASAAAETVEGETA
jgi:hypothetical protein